LSTTPGPGLRNQAGARTFFRVLGVVLTAVGVVVFVWGISKVFADTGFEGPEPSHVVAFIGGLPLIGFGLMALNIGFLGATARYGAGEAMPVLRDSAAYLSDGQGVLGVGRTVDDPAAPAAASGPYCRSCGVRNDADARFCDGCGAGLA
jgi:hypothetical protein